MTQDQYLAICEQVCRNVFNRLEVLELSENPSMADLECFRDEVKKQLRGYQDALGMFLVDDSYKNLIIS